MFIAHLPAGYLLTRWLQKNIKIKQFLWIGLIASIFPDIDLLYFYFIDHKQTLHHHYWTHLPLFWLMLWLVFTLLCILLKQKPLLKIGAIFFANIYLHLILDTFVGGINWLYPFIDHDFFLVTVPATHTFWVWSFIFHWSFLVELAIICWAALFFWKEQIQKRSN